MSALLTWFSLLFFGGPLSTPAPGHDPSIAQADQQDLERAARSNDNDDEPPFWAWIHNPISNGF